ncbi:MAG: hypothetical protein VCE43_23765 [Myxococcota bacterium]
MTSDVTFDEAGRNAARGWHRAASAAAVACTFIGLAIWSFGKWPDVLVDFGRELYVPWRLLNGDVLYADVAHFNGPLSPYLNALWFRCFGVGLSTLVWVNLFVLAGTAAAAFWLLERLANTLAATAAVIVFLCIFAFGHVVAYGNYNFVTPYSHEVVHGFGLSLLAFLCAMRCSGKASGWDAATGLLLGLVFLTKAEFFVAALLGVGVCWVCIARGRMPEADPIWRPVVVLMAGALFPVVSAWLLLSLAMPAAEAFVGILGSWPGIASGDAASLQFYQRWMGIDRIAANSASMWIEFAGLLAIAVVAALADRLSGRSPRWVQFALVFASGALVGMGGFLPSWLSPNWMRVGRSLPLVALGCIVLATLRWLRAGDHTRRSECAGIGFAVFAFALLLKMILAARVYHYGFALAAPAAMLLVIVAVDWIPTELRRIGGSGRVFRGVALVLIAAATWNYVLISAGRYETKVVPIGENQDAFLARPTHAGVLSGRAAAVRKVLVRSAALPEDATVLVLPEGVILNYLARRRSPTRFITFLPPELVLFGERRIVDALIADPPTTVVLVHKDTREYGYPLFGRDYGQEIMNWVRESYEPSGPPIGDEPLVPGSRFGVWVWDARAPSPQAADPAGATE